MELLIGGYQYQVIFSSEYIEIGAVFLLDVGFHAGMEFRGVDLAAVGGGLDFS